MSTTVTSLITKAITTIEGFDANAFFVEFVPYFNEFYGTDGIYPNKLGGDISAHDMLEGTLSLLNDRPDYEWAGDSVDRELLRDALREVGKLDPKY
jgi:hypothetical protein